MGQLTLRYGESIIHKVLPIYRAYLEFKQRQELTFQRASIGNSFRPGIAVAEFMEERDVSSFKKEERDNQNQ